MNSALAELLAIDMARLCPGLGAHPTDAVLSIPVSTHPLYAPTNFPPALRSVLG